MNGRQWLSMAGASALMLVGCAGPIPSEKLQSSSSAIRAAEELGADKVPQAALHLQLAKEQSEKAKKMIADGDRDEAGLVLLRAEADANLAVALARNSSEQHEAQSAQDKVKDLQQQNAR